LKNFKLNTTTLSFVPILVFIPLFYELFRNIHLGGIDLISELFLAAFSPKINSEILISLFYRLSETIFIAFTSWFISIIIGFVFGLLSTDKFYQILNLPLIIGKLIKYFLIIIRSIHELIWGLVLIQIYGINITVGIISICIPYISINAKVISEQIDNIDNKIIISILEISGKNFPSLITLIWNPTIIILKNFGIYRLECALRSTAILGIYGLGGIGTSIYLSFKALSFNELWTYLYGLGLIIFFSKNILKNINLQKINSRILFSIFTTFGFFTICAILYFYNFIVNPSNPFTYNINTFLNSNSDFISFEFFKLIFENIILSISAAAIAISIPPFFLLLFNDKFGIFLVRLISFFIRLIPPSITTLVLLMFNNPSISLASLALGIYNAAIISKLLITNLNNIEKDQFIALSSIGASKRLSWLLGLFSKQSKTYLAYCAYRFDILIRETAIVGVIGCVGLGWQLQESISSFAWEEVSIILVSFSVITIIGELINGKIKENFI
tara:strand:- start:10524 stop:12026 length:1503 start_codon:yes stop_codon:yes gene_type:complete